ncbi:MAG TPA: IS3 family transposase [Dermatophilaceae bacterium]|nr:IS3 family transposase [Dermatophilaceae bacterium]
MPKKIDPAVKERALRMVSEHRSEYASLTACCDQVGRRLGLGKETVRRWALQADIDAGARPGVSTEESAEIKRLKAENRRLTEDLEIMRRASNFLRGGTRPPQPVICEFIDQMRSEGHAVESICRGLRKAGLQIAARTYREWTSPRRAVAARTVSDAEVEDVIRKLVWQPDEQGRRKMQPAGLYGRRKMLAEVRRTGLAAASPGAVDRVMRTLGLSGVVRAKKVYTTVADPDVVRAPDLLDRDFTSDRPDRVWVADFTYVRTWAGFVYVAFVVDVFAQRIVAWNAATTRHADLVTIPLRMALWQRDREGRPVAPKTLISHSDAGSQYTSVAFTERLALQGIAPSIGSVGDAYDNALMETINGLYKAECIRSSIFHDGPYKTISDVEYATAAWVEWYNNERLHSSLGYVPPIEFEQSYYAALNRELQPT